MKSFDEFVKSQKNGNQMGKKKIVGAITIANQINGLLGLKDVGDNMRKGFVSFVADNPKKGMTGTVLVRLKKKDGSPFMEEEINKGSYITEGLEQEELHLQFPVSEPCEEVRCKSAVEMHNIYDDAVERKWCIEPDDDPHELEFGFIVSNLDGRTRYSVPYSHLVKVGG